MLHQNFAIWLTNVRIVAKKKECYPSMMQKMGGSSKLWPADESALRWRFANHALVHGDSTNKDRAAKPQSESK
jgi:hypothetical protein